MRRILALVLITWLVGCGGDSTPVNTVSLDALVVTESGLQPDWSVRLSPDIMAAIDSGVGVTFQECWQWLDSAHRWRDGGQRELRLSHRVLTGNYLIRHLERDELRVFPGRSALLRGMRRTGTWPAAPSEARAVRLRLRLQRTALPGSLRLQAVWNQHWHADSGWVRQTLSDGLSS